MTFPIAFLWQRDRKSPAGTPKAWESADDCERFFAEPAQGFRTKDALPLWSPAVFEGDYRKNERVQHVTGLVVDVDEPSPTFPSFTSKLADALPGVAFIAHTTFSALLGAVRCRAFVPISRSLTVGEHRSAWPVLRSWLAEHGLEIDAQCKDPARAFYVPAVPPCGFYAHHREPGRLLDVDATLREAAAVELETGPPVSLAPKQASAEQRTPPPTRSGDLHRLACSYLFNVPESIQGQNGSGALWCAIGKLYDLGIDKATTLSALRYQWNQRCRPPWSDDELERTVNRLWGRKQGAE